MTNMPARIAVEFRELRSDEVVAVCQLSDTLDAAQRRMVADNAISIAQGHCSPDAWMRAVYAGGEPIGFAMLHEGDDISDGIDCEGPFLWRLMIAGPQQGKGYGRAAVEPLVAMLRAPNAAPPAPRTRAAATRQPASPHPRASSPAGPSVQPASRRRARA